VGRTATAQRTGFCPFRKLAEEQMPDDPGTRLLALSDLTQKDRIQILLSEYAALRAELVSRTGYGFQIAAVALVGITWSLQQPLSGRFWLFWVIMGIVAGCFVIAIFGNTRDITRVAHRLRDIEIEVNSRAGEHLLVWETLSGAVTRMGIWRPFVDRTKTLPRSQLPPLDPPIFSKKQPRRMDVISGMMAVRLEQQRYRNPELCTKKEP
jgi:hypothetical protein